MRTTITKTVSMMLVTVMVLGIFAMPMRAHADAVDDLVDPLINKISDPYWRAVVFATKEIAKEMLNPINNSPNTSAISKFSAFFEPFDTGKHMFVTADQMNELSSSLLGYGINVQPSIIPGGYWALVLLDDKVGGETGTITLDANPGDVYVYEGYTVVRLVSPGNDSSDTDTDSAIESNRPSYAPVDPIQPESPPAGGNGNLVVGPSGTIINQNTTTINQNTINNNDYEIKLVDGRTFYYNRQTDTYYIKNYNGDYVECLNINYNPVTQTYHTTTNEWNSTTNNYDQRQYTYQFYYDYTYITYIGSSAEYREAYKVYYELPDGRSSGDLTADELKGISLQFDMVNYDKAASDTLTRALFSFDGDVNNSSYFDSNFTWVSNASTEYLDSPDGFGGSLFVDPSNSESRFNISFPEIGSSDPTTAVSFVSSFTLQFRVYFTQPSSSSKLLIALNGSWNGYNSYEPTSTLSNWLRPYRRLWSQDRAYLIAALSTSGLESFYISPGQTTSQSHIYSTLNPGSWYDVTICYYRDSPWIFTDSPVSPGYYYFYVNGLLVGSTPVYGFDPQSSNSTLTQRYWTPAGEVTSGSMFSPVIPYALNGIYFIAREGGSPFQIDNLRFVSTALYTGVQSFTPTPVPFDTNLVYVLPSVADLNDNTVAIMSQLPVSGYRVGGIRPTDPTLATGYIYMHIDGDFVDSVQQWNGAYWEEVTARLYTGIRWIPVTAFNVFTLEDMFDIIDPDADGSGPGVDSIFQYYLWWSGEWGTFQEWLKGTMQTLIEAIQASGGGGSTDAPVVIVPGVNDQTTTSEITTDNPDGSITKTTIVSNAAGLVYSNSVTTYPTDVNGNTKTITVYTDSSGVMYQTETIIDKDGNVTVTEPTKATGTLGSILKMITGGVMEIAGTVIEGFVTIVVDGVKFIIESADSLIDGVGSMISSLASSITDFAGTVEDNLVQPGVDPSVDGDDDEQGDGDGGSTYNMFDVFFEVLPPEIVTALTLCFIAMIALPIINKMHF